MIPVTRLDRQEMLLNPDHIVTIEETPDTVITLFNGVHLLVKERAEEIVNRIIAFRGMIARRAGHGCRGRKYLARRNRSFFSGRPFVPVSRNDSSRAPFHTQDS